MKIKNHFTDYLLDIDNNNLHPQHQILFDKLPNNLLELQHLIFYGPKGVGKYTQCLNLIKKYSPSKLNYENKFIINYQNKNTYQYKISDVHYEVDMSLLGCNAKGLWNDIFQQILDIISIKQDKFGIIVCKYFHEINSELLEVFYSYIQDYQISILKKLNIKFILLTEEISFIPNNIINICNVISFERPSIQSYNKLLTNTNKLINNYYSENITNIKNLKLNIKELVIPHEFICNKIIDQIKTIDDINIILLRENLYELLIYNINIFDSIWYIIKTLHNNELIIDNQLQEIFNETYKFFRQYNNNYRPIFHLEKYILYLCKIIHGIK